jgi:hypothetical protein
MGFKYRPSSSLYPANQELKKDGVFSCYLECGIDDLVVMEFIVQLQFCLNVGNNL